MLKWFPMAELILYYSIEAPDVEEKLYEHREFLDYSEYPIEHK